MGVPVGSLCTKPFPNCPYCVHLDVASLDSRPLRCAAFPTGVPEQIAIGFHKHTDPFPGDGGMLFQERTDLDGEE